MKNAIHSILLQHKEDLNSLCERFRVAHMNKWLCLLAGAILLFVSGCATEHDQGVATNQHRNSVLEKQEDADAYRTIKKDLDALYSDLRALEKVRGKPLNRDVHVALDKAMQAIAARDYQSSLKYYGFVLEFIRDHLVDEAAVEEYRQALASIGKRLKNKGACQGAWNELIAYRLEQKLKNIIIPEMTFRPPATLIDAVDFLKQASRDYDNKDVPVECRGVGLILRLACNNSEDAGESEDPFAQSQPIAQDVPVIPSLSAHFISLYDALSLLCDVTGYQFHLSTGLIMIEPLEEELEY